MQENNNKRSRNLRDRSKRLVKNKRREFQVRMIMINSALALIIIMIVLICKVVNLNQSMKEEQNKQVNKNVVTGQAIKKKDKKDTKVKEKVPQPTKAPVVQVVGKDKWIRKNLDKTKPMVALTFDDGPYTPVTSSILSTLKKYNAKATFFVVGNRTSGRDVVKKAYDMGCQIGSHTFSHTDLARVKAKKIVSEVKKADEAISKQIGCGATALRPPGGLINEKVRKNVNKPLILWNVDSEDWKSRNTKKIIKRCNNISDGDIVLMHDLYPASARAIKKIIPKLQKKGFILVTVDELFYYKGIKLENGKSYFSGK